MNWTKGRGFKVFILFWLLGLLIYSNSLNNQFIIDDYLFTQNPVLSRTQFILSQWNPYREQALGVAESSDNFHYYRPMAHMVLDYCYATFKNSFWRYHLLNLFLFVVASWMIYILVLNLTQDVLVAFLAGIFYLIHPINGVIVNYISGIVFALQLIFMLGAILLFLVSLEKKNRWIYLLSLCCFFLSFFWNESGLLAPFYLLVVILLMCKESLKEKIIYFLPYFLIFLSYIVFRAFYLEIKANTFNEIRLFHMSGWEYLASYFQLIIWYVGKLFYPKGIVLIWAMPVLRTHIIENLIGLGLALTGLILVLVNFKSRIVKLSLIWMTIGFASLGMAAVISAERGFQLEPHWFVFSSIGFFIITAYLFRVLLQRFVLLGLVLLSILIFTWIENSHAYNKLWTDQTTYTSYWSKQIPGYKPVYYWLGNSYQRQGALEEARHYYHLALTGCYVSDANIYLNLGVIDEDMAHLKDAELNYKMALKINPKMVEAYDDLGSMYLSQGKLKIAQQYFEGALGLDPMLLNARRGLAMVFAGEGEYQRAIDCCVKNLDIVNDDLPTLRLLTFILSAKRDLTLLPEYAHRLIKLEQDPDYLTRLAAIFSLNNFPDLARDCYVRALQIAPAYKNALIDEGILFQKLGNCPRAVEIWKEGMALYPSDQRFENYIDHCVSP